MSRARKFQDPVRVSFITERSFLKHIQSEARYMSNVEQQNIPTGEMIRRGLKTSFPYNETKDMFK